MDTVIPTGHQVQTSSTADRAEPFPDAPPAGFAVFEEYNRLQLAFMKVMRTILRRKQLYGWPPDA
ncbi:MAG TPA: hypothetical protein VK272_12770 [Solirubrobacteraceae bacterium]|nr:hypothetical protein [Solirubrobacteraceae bacterium]